MDLVGYLSSRSRRTRRLVACLVPVPICIVAISTVVAIYDGVAAQGEWREQVSVQLSTARGYVAAEEALRQALTEAERSPLWERMYPPGDVGEIANTFQGDMSRLLSEAQVENQSFIQNAVEPLEGVNRLSCTVTAVMTIDRLQSYLGSLRRYTRHIQVEKMVVSAPLSQQPTVNPPLNVTLGLAGYQLVTRSAP